MAPKRKCRTPSHKSSLTDASSVGESRAVQSVAAAKDGTSKKPARYRQFEKPHDQKVTELSHVLRGGGNSVEFENTHWVSESSLLHLTNMGLREDAVRMGMEMIDPSEMEKLKKRWRQLRLSELKLASKKAELAYKKAELIYDQVKLFIDIYDRVN